MKQAIIFSSKVWLPAICIAPCLNLFILSFLDNDNQVDVDLIISMQGFWYTFTMLHILVPLWLVFCMFAIYLNGRNLTTTNKKRFLTIIAVILTIIPFLSANGHDLMHIKTLTLLLAWLLSYIGITVYGIWFYKLEPVTNPAEK